MVFKALSKIKIKVDLKPTVDSLVFRLHYRYTNRILLASTLLTTLYDVVGKKIDCITNVGSDSFKEVVDNYCFIMGTFTVDRLHEKQVGVQVPHPGVGPPEPDDELTFHSYYQWVPFVLFAQSLLFYAPHWLWKQWEGGLFKTVIQDLSVRDYLGREMKPYFSRDERYRALSSYIQNHIEQHKRWVFRFFLCEALNLVVVLSTLYFTDWFLGGEFLTYGTDVIQVAGMDPENRTDPMAFVFPRMAKCTFKSFGSSGTIQIRDVMCLIATNIINEKIYLFLWVWLVTLTALTAVWVVYRLLVMLLPCLRVAVLKLYVRESFHSDVTAIMKESSLSEWFLLVSLGNNMEATVFGEFLRFFAKDQTKSTDTIPMHEYEKERMSM
ncbi:innexin inx2-like isoform X1 [Penaeus indicus]|uniref:innexin inx2-like isoform X1 n=2 Tax=Penaeus indicus TaxID=29960 RepID=UPI00300CDDC2